MAQYTINELLNASGGSLIQSFDRESKVENLLIDSRKLLHPESTLFFAIKSSSNDGHEYIQGLYERGVRNFIVSNQSEEYNKLEFANFILVDDVITALQEIASHHRNHFKGKLIGITGSNGKTVVKEWLHHMLHDESITYRSPRSYNSQVGVPLSLWLGEEKDEIIIIEAGISKPGEMIRQKQMIRPDIGILTNIRQAHQENFSSLEQKVIEKIKLFTDADTLVYCSDNSLIAEAVKKHLGRTTLFSWSMKQPADLQLVEIKRSGKETSFDAIYKGGKSNFTIPFTDDASLENSLHCIATLLVLAYDTDSIREKLKGLYSLNMRMEMKEGINNCILINDAYSSDLDSLQIALDFLSQQSKDRKKTVILSDILQSGLKREELYKKVNILLEQHNIGEFIGIGNEISQCAEVFSMHKHFYPGTSEFLNYHSLINFRDESILIKGARVFGFEKIGRVLAKKSHETVLEINLNAMVHNLNYYRSILEPGCKIMAMVKAFSYGSGSHEIASLMQFHNADYLAVAYTDEGIALRKSGIIMPIMVMSPEYGNFESVFEHNLEPEIFSLSLLQNLERYVVSRDRERTYPVHIKLDTGMHRLGFNECDLEVMMQILHNNPQIEVKSIFSHLAGSDNHGLDEFTREQLRIFNVLSKGIEETLKKNTLRHILNSAGIKRFPEAHFNMVRPGIGLYGISADPDEQKLLMNTSTFKTRITQIRELEEGETVGYNRHWMATKTSRIAIVPAGYADGISRKLGNGKGRMMTGGVYVPIVGNICMDMCMIDVSHVEVSEGDDVIIFGEGLPVNEVAETLDTIPYEILTGVSGRVKRVYIYE